MTVAYQFSYPTTVEMTSDCVRFVAHFSFDGRPCISETSIRGLAPYSAEHLAAADARMVSRIDAWISAQSPPKPASEVKS